MNKKILGVDEAGRGPVLGPMVICGALIQEGDEERLIELGVKDSKKLTPERREELFEELKEILIDFRLVEIWPRQIDHAVKHRGLNSLEAEVSARLIKELEPDVAILDAPGRYPEGYLREVKRFLGESKVKVIAENKADEKYPIVSAASILAKVRRDRIIEELKKDYGDFGSGYAGDPRTVEFLRMWVRKHRELPPIARASWETAAKILTEERAGLGQYFL